MRRAKEALDTTLEWICVVLFAIMVVAVAWQVFARQVLSSPSGWSEELSRYLFIWLGLLGTALVFGERGHIAVELVVAHLPKKGQQIVAVFVQILTIGFSACVLIYGGVRVSAMTWQQNLTGLPVNVGWLYTVLPLAGVLTLFYSFYHLVAIVQGKESALNDGEPDVI